MEDASVRSKVWLASFVFAATASAFGASFKGAIEGDTVIIYSTAKKTENCSASIMFSYKKGDERETRRLECNGPAMAEKDYVFCKRSNPEFVDLKIERPANGGCE